MILRKDSVEEQLVTFENLTEARTDLLPDESSVAWAFKTRCHATLDQLSDAERSAYKAREFYGRHLGLDGTELEAYIKHDFKFYESEDYRKRDLEDTLNNPWLFELFDGTAAGRLAVPEPHALIGDSPEERRLNAVPMWLGMGEDDDRVRSYLAVLFVRLFRYQQAAATLDYLLNRTEVRGAEIRGELEFRMLWPSVLAGECYAALGYGRQAIACWQRVRSLELYRDLNKEFFDEFGFFWIEKARAALRRENILIPSLADSKKAGEHLCSGWHWMLQAEAWLGDDLNAEQILNKLAESAYEFRIYVERAYAELQAVLRYDPFTRSLIADREGNECWIRSDFVLAEILHFRGLIHLSMDQTTQAVAVFKESLSTLSSLGTYPWLGLAYEMSGAHNEALEVFRYIVMKGKALANPLMEDDEFCELIIQNARSLI